MTTERNVLATIRAHAESHRRMADCDAYSAQEAPRLESALAAVTELVAAGTAVRARVPTQWLEGMAAGRMPPGDGLFLKWQDVAKLAAALRPFTGEQA